MITRLALESDLGNVKECFESYSDEALKKDGIEMARSRAWEAVAYLVRVGLCYIGIADNKVVAGMAGFIQPGLFTNDIFFSAMFFYVMPEYRTETRCFIDGVSRELKGKEVTQIVIANPEFYAADKLDRYYRLNGFQLLERHYARKI